MRKEEKFKEIVQSILSLSGKLAMDVIAEGVETKEEFIILEKMNCYNFQGYYFSRPAKEKDIIINY